MIHVCGRQNSNGRPHSSPPCSHRQAEPSPATSPQLGGIRHVIKRVVERARHENCGEMSQRDEGNEQGS